MTELRHELADVTTRDLVGTGEVGARGEDELFASHGHRIQLASRRASLQFVEHSRQFDERRRPQGVGAGVVAVVVEGDERKPLAAGQREIAHIGMCHHLIGVERDQFRKIDAVVLGDR